MIRVLLATSLLAILAACGGGRDPGRVPNAVVEKIAAVEGRGGCGIDNAWRVTEVAGVRLSRPATLSRKAVRTLEDWMSSHAIPIIGQKGGGLSQIRVAAHYACRTRNSRRGARLSEHVRGNAIDISAFILADGTVIDVEDAWNGRYRRIARRLHASACGPFGTVLGPDSDRYHRDHFHFDVADHRSGSYCR